MMDLKTVTSPTLGVSGEVDVAFGEMEKVDRAYAYVENPAISDFVFGCSTSVSGNVVEVTVMKIDITQAAANAWIAAITADLNTFDIVVVADGI